jgi:hypothetical protein
MYQIFNHKGNSHPFYAKYLDAVQNTILYVIYTLIIVVFFYKVLYFISNALTYR